MDEVIGRDTEVEERVSGDARTEGLVMYCRSWCPDCSRARHWLDQRGIPYVEIDVDDDVDARQRAQALNEGRLHTPTFELGEEHCVDFRPATLEELLRLM